MKRFIGVVAVLFFASPSVQAQEHGGHGNEQRQQRKAAPYRRYVIRGTKAEALYQKMVVTEKIQDLGNKCSEPVVTVGASSQTICFDRGEHFREDQFFGPSRYKCYVSTHGLESFVGFLLFDLTHNSCGGDGIHLVYQQ